MKRLPALRGLAAVLALVLVAMGCAKSPSDAATVNGRGIPAKDVLGEVDATIVAVNALTGAEVQEPARQALLAQLTDPTGEGPAPAAAANALTNQIFSSIIEQALEGWGIAVEEVDVASAESSLVRDIVTDRMPEPYRQAAIDNAARTSRVSRYLTDQAGAWSTEDDVTAYVNLKRTDPDFAAVQACTAHILVEDEALAADLRDQLQGGADFAELAAAHSIDTSNSDDGGALGCAPEGSFVPEFEDAIRSAADGELVGPVETMFGFHLIQVTTTYAAPSADALRDSARQRLASPLGWLELTLSRTRISVDSKFGTWDADQLTVVPPSGATPS